MKGYDIQIGQNLRMITCTGSLPVILMSLRDVTDPSNPPNILSSPSITSMRKRRIDQKMDPGIWLIASVRATNARPVPSAF